MTKKVLFFLLIAVTLRAQTVSYPATGIVLPDIGKPGFATIVNNDLTQLNLLLTGTVKYPTGVFYFGVDAPGSCTTETYLYVSTANPVIPKGFLCNGTNWVQMFPGSGGSGTGWTIGVFSGLPVGTCTAGSAYFATDKPYGAQLFLCNSTNVWTQFLLLDGSGFLILTAGALGGNPALIANLQAANTFAPAQFFTGGISDYTTGTQPTCDSSHPAWIWPLVSGGNPTNQQSCLWNGSTWIWTNLGASGGASGDYYHGFIFPAANQNGGTPGNAWSIPATNGCAITARTGTNVVSGTLTVTSSTNCQFRFYLPQGWDTAVLPYVRINFISSDAVNAHTIIPSVALYCSNGGGTNTDDGSFNTAQTLSTTTLNGTAFREWTVSNVQLNSTSMTGAIAGSYCNVKVSASGTATDMEITSAVVTVPVKLNYAGPE